MSFRDWFRITPKSWQAGPGLQAKPEEHDHTFIVHSAKQTIKIYLDITPDTTSVSIRDSFDLAREYAVSMFELSLVEKMHEDFDTQVPRDTNLPRPNDC